MIPADDRIEVPADEVITVLYRLQTDLRILIEQLARDPAVVVPSRLLDHLYVSQDYLGRRYPRH